MKSLNLLDYHMSFCYLWSAKAVSQVPVNCLNCSFFLLMPIVSFLISAIKAFIWWMVTEVWNATESRYLVAVQVLLNHYLDDFKLIFHSNILNSLLQGCPRGFFGDGCLNNCSVNCDDPMECHRVTGRCFDGCQSGWGDPTCNTSTSLFFLVCF